MATRLSRHKADRLLPGILAGLLVLPGIDVGAEAEIHRCVQDDGTVAFQEMPCAEPPDAPSGESADDRQDDDVAALPADEFFDFVNPFDQPGDVPVPAEPGPMSPVSQDRAECEQTTRDAIDEIDLEMRKGYTREQGRQYLAELLELTQQLRECKQL
jgi:hypothetical protein